jgi:hypothetical protein
VRIFSCIVSDGSFNTFKQTDLEVLPIWVICSTLELDDGFHGESKLGTVNDLTGALVALDILALVVEDEGLWLLLISYIPSSIAR